MADALLEVEALEAGYGEVQVLWGVSLKAGRGHLTSIVGANGAGKTTMLRAVAGTIAPWKGRVVFEGEDVTRLSTHEKSARGFALVPEGRQLFSKMTVGRKSRTRRLLQARGAQSTPNGSTRCSRCFPVSPSGSGRSPARCPAASSRWWRSPAA